MGKPIVQCATAPGVADGFDAEANLRKADRADIKESERLRVEKSDDVGLGPRPPKFGKNVRVE
jgi:hypothetical protein